jgi:hypothetical protein
MLLVEILNFAVLNSGLGQLTHQIPSHTLGLRSVLNVHKQIPMST